MSVFVKEKDDEGCYSQLTVGELKKLIDEEKDGVEVYIRICRNPCGNIISAGTADKSTYGFFGTSIPCIIIEPTDGTLAKK